MSTLFTISKSPAGKLLGACLRTASEGDCLLFIEDGVYHGSSEKALAGIPESIHVYCLKEDLMARGLAEKLQDRVQTASYRQFVQLCTEYNKVVSWF